MIVDPIYLLDFRNQRVVELDPATDVSAEKPSAGSQSREPFRKGIVFASLGSPVEHKD